MKTNTALCVFLILLSTAAIGQTQVTTPEGSAPTDLIPKVPSNDLAEVQSVMLEAYQAKELAEINAQIDALLDKREDLMFEVAAKLHPQIAEKIRNVADHYKAEKKKNRGGK